MKKRCLHPALWIQLASAERAESAIVYKSHKLKGDKIQEKQQTNKNGDIPLPG